MCYYTLSCKIVLLYINICCSSCRIHIVSGICKWCKVKIHDRCDPLSPSFVHNPKIICQYMISCSGLLNLHFLCIISVEPYTVPSGGTQLGMLQQSSRARLASSRIGRWRGAWWRQGGDPSRCFKYVILYRLYMAIHGYTWLYIALRQHKTFSGLPVVNAWKPSQPPLEVCCQPFAALILSHLSSLKNCLGWVGCSVQSTNWQRSDRSHGQGKCLKVN